MKVAVIGGGAAGFFAALSTKEHHPQSEVILFEKSKNVLSKVRISGGGRCNVTNGSPSIKELSESYPRGKNFMKNVLKTFNTKDTWNWFEQRGVSLKVEADGRVFPMSNDSNTIIQCLLSNTKEKEISIQINKGVISLQPDNKNGFVVKTKDHSHIFDKVIIATGGSPKVQGFDWIKVLGHKIEKPVPSLFTFNMPDEPVKKLMGVVASNASVSVQGQKIKTEGPILITHWGMSGPAILKASAFGARILHDLDYQFNVNVNWVNQSNQEDVKQNLQSILKEHSKKQLSSYRPYELPDRLWQFLLIKNDLDGSKKWEDLGKKGINRIISSICHDTYQVSGKTTFKEEFVTCGGISLLDINRKTMESSVCPGLYFAGEIIDVDGITGGYNFQAAWSTGYIAGKLQ